MKLMKSVKFSNLLISCEKSGIVDLTYLVIGNLVQSTRGFYLEGLSEICGY